MDSFPSNSKARVEPKEIKQVTSAKIATGRKRGLGRRFRETFIAGDSRSAFEYMFVDVVVPAIQDTLIDAFQGGVERLIRGESPRHRRNIRPTTYSELGHVDYRGMNTGARRSVAPAQRMMSRRSRARQNFDELVIQTLPEAHEVIDRMYDILSRYGSVSVADLYELTGVQSAHTDMKWGWYDLRGAKAARLRQGGYLLDLPEPEELGNGR
jgi:hypothetical protein